MNNIGIIFYIAGFILAYGLIYWRYNKEIKIRLKWMEKRLKNGNWKFIIALIGTLYLSIVLINLVFGSVSDDFIIKPFFVGFFLLLFFMIFLFKYFYEIIGGKRKWKL